MPRLSNWITQRVAFAVTILGGAATLVLIGSGSVTEDVRTLLMPAILVAIATILIDTVRQHTRSGSAARFGLALVVLYLIIVLFGLVVTLLELLLG